LFELLDPPVGLHSSWHIAIKIVCQHEQGVWAYAMIGTPSLHRGGNRSLLSGFSYGSPITKCEEMIALGSGGVPAMENSARESEELRIASAENFAVCNRNCRRLHPRVLSNSPIIHSCSTVTVVASDRHIEFSERSTARRAQGRTALPDKRAGRVFDKAELIVGVSYDR
jgi:hypothetical protein